MRRNINCIYSWVDKILSDMWKSIRISTEYQNLRKGLNNSFSANRAHFAEALNMAIALLPSIQTDIFDYLYI